MTRIEFTKGINAELKRQGFAARVAKTIDCGVNTTLVFHSGGINMRLICWLNNRFAYGISMDETTPNYVYLNTPLDKRVELDEPIKQ